MSIAGKHSAHARANRRGILYMASGMSCLVINDSLMKYLGQTFGVAQLVCIRGIMAILMILAVAQALGVTARMGTLLDPRVATRAAIDSIGTLLYLGSLMHLPIGNATAINLAAPLIMALLAVFFLGEHPGIRRWLAIGAGFIGVILVIQPRLDNFNAWALMCLTATIFQSTRDLQTRRIAADVPAILIALASVGFVTVIASGLILIQGWRPIGHFAIGLLAIAAALLAAGYYLIVNSMRHGEMSMVAPFRYCGLLVALLTGFIVWGEVPSALAWGGIALLLAAGVYLLHDERRRVLVAAGFAAVFCGALVAPSSAIAQVPPTAAEIARYDGLLTAAYRGDVAQIAKLAAAKSDVNVRDGFGRTPLHVATFAKQREAIRALVAAGADPGLLENDRYDAVTIAAVADDEETLRVLLSLGASAKLVTSRYDGTALIAAAHLGHDGVVKQLIAAKAPLDHVNNLHWTALIESIVLGNGGPRHVETLRALVGASANTQLADRQGTTPLALARGRGYGEMVRILEQAGAR